MNDALTKFKETLLGTGLFRKVSGEGQYVCKVCPYCGDVKNHLYVLIKFDDTPVLYKCFKCNSSGVLDKKFMEYFDIQCDIPNVRRRRKIELNTHLSSKVSEFVNNRMDLMYVYDYINERVGITPTFDDLKAFQVVGNPYEYAREYLGGDCTGFKNRVWFRCTNGTLVGRSLRDDVHLRWKKYCNMSTSRGLYTIKKPFDLTKTVNVCICEGVMDAIGLYYYNIQMEEIDNPVFIACLGSDYMSAVKYILNLGIFGDSVCIRIYKDADVESVKIDHRLCAFFKSVNVYMNSISKDYGVPSEMIEIVRV